MMRKLIPPIAAGAALAVASPAAAQHAPVRAGHYNLHRENNASILAARIATINVRIEMLSERGAIGRDEARELRQQSRRLQGHLYGLSPREVSDLEVAIDRLERQVRFAADDARWGGHVFDRGDEDRFEADDGYRSESHAYSTERGRDHRDTFQRWDDPFDQWDEERDRNNN